MAPVDGKTALQLAAQYGHSKVATILLAHKANIEARCEHIGTQWENKLWLGRTPLIWAAAGQKTSGSRQEAMVKLLLDRGADMTARSHTHRTALQEAVMSILHNNDPRNIVRMLLDRGALVNAFDIEGWTALSEAACRTSEAARRGLDALELHRELALELLRHGANVEGRPPISDPAYRSNPISEGPPNKPLLLTGRDHLSKIPTDRIVELLLDYSANFNARLAMGEALIHVAARQGKPIVVLKLLGAGCEVDIKDTRNGDTPLHKAASKGQNDVIQALLKRGASVRAENDLGQDARQQALSHGHMNAAEVLAKHMQTHEK